MTSQKDSRMLLVIDISNTTIKAGVFRGQDLYANWRFSTERHKLADDYGMLLLDLFRSEGIEADGFEGVSVSCVVPPLRSVFRNLCERYLGLQPLMVGPGTDSGISLAVDHPEEVGADRIVNASATYHIYGGPAIAIAFGTATVLDCVSAKGEYLGGAIAPGMIIALESLAVSAAQLYQVDVVSPPNPIGKNTIHMMQSGLVLGYAGLVEGLVARLRKEMIADEDSGPVKIIATGGLAEIVAPETEVIETIDQHLTLNGLRILYDRAAGNS